VGKYCYVAFAQRCVRAWVPTGGVEGWGHIVSPCKQLVKFILVCENLCSEGEDV